tara:strand:- start:158 stop:397 length:240 start_codon:yes stop_codon:yes gene_type:complete
LKKITELKEGELLTLDSAAAFVKQMDETLEQAKRRLRRWRDLYPQNPDKYPKSAKIGGTVYYLKSHLIDFLNREFNKAS